MTSNFYCQICDKHLNKKNKRKHMTTKKHLIIKDNIVINKINIENLNWGCLIEKNR